MDCCLSDKPVCKSMVQGWLNVVDELHALINDKQVFPCPSTYSVLACTKDLDLDSFDIMFDFLPLLPLMTALVFCLDFFLSSFQFC